MELRRSWGAVALLCVLLPGGHPSPCWVSIFPEEPTVEFGTPLLLNCTSSCQNYSQLNWEVSVHKMWQQGPGWVSLSIAKVTDWSLELQCFGVFGGQRNITVTPLRAYQFSPPQISLGGEVVAGRRASVTCRVSARVPPQEPLDLNLTLEGGGLPPSTQRGPEATVDFVARPEQHGQEVTCEAALRLGRRLVVNSTTTTLWVYAAPHHIQLWASRTEFATGDNLTVTCQAQGNPPPGLQWVLPTNSSVELRDGGTTVVIPAAQREHNGTYRCLAGNRYGTGAASVDILFRGSSRSLVIPVVVAVAVVIAVAVLGFSWWMYHSRGWKPMPGGSQPG